MNRFLLVFFFYSGLASAQTSVTSKQFHDYTKESGSFNYNIKNNGVEEHININYILYPAPFYTTLNFALGTAYPLSMHATIVNTSGVTVLKWSPASESYKYHGQFDISSLAPGKYTMDVYAGTSQKKTYSIPFEKMAAK